MHVPLKAEGELPGSRPENFRCGRSAYGRQTGADDLLISAGEELRLSRPWNDVRPRLVKVRLAVGKEPLAIHLLQAVFAKDLSDDLAARFVLGDAQQVGRGRGLAAIATNNQIAGPVLDELIGFGRRCAGSAAGRDGGSARSAIGSIRAARPRSSGPATKIASSVKQFAHPSMSPRSRHRQ